MNPIGFKTDSGKVFDIHIKKTNIRTMWIALVEKGKEIKMIKVRKKSPKLIWRKEA